MGARWGGARAGARVVWLASVALGACGGGDAPQADSTMSASPLPAAANDSAPGPATAGETGTLPTSSPSQAGEFRLAGNEPFWGVRISAKGLTYTTPDYKDGILFPSTAPQATGKTLRWIALTSAPNAHTLEVTLVEEKCQDTTADKSWTHRATVVFDGSQVTGCGERLGK